MMINLRFGAVVAVLVAGGAAVAVTAVSGGADAAVPRGALVVSHGGGATGGTGGTCATPNYATIQSAIDAAATDDTIYVCAGTYRQQLSIDKRLVIDGPLHGVSAKTGRRDRTREAVLSTAAPIVRYLSLADRGTLDGLELLGAPSSTASIVASDAGMDLNVRNTIIDGGFEAIAMGLSDHGMINRNRIQNMVGHAVFTSGADIERNTFVHNRVDVDLAGGAETVYANTSTGSLAFITMAHTTGAHVTTNRVSNPVQAGIVVEGLNYASTVSHNTIIGSGGAGILSSNRCCLYDSWRTSAAMRIVGNTITRSRTGIRIDTSPTQYPSSIADSLVRGNTITHSSGTGIEVHRGSAELITFRHNRVSASGDTDCVDATVGQRSRGTANSWFRNIGKSSQPSGLC
jgi:hypothetical protein